MVWRSVTRTVRLVSVAAFNETSVSNKRRSVAKRMSQRQQIGIRPSRGENGQVMLILQ